MVHVLHEPELPCACNVKQPSVGCVLTVHQLSWWGSGPLVESRRVTPGEIVFAVTLVTEVSCPGSMAMDVPLSILLTDVSCGSKGQQGD